MSAALESLARLRFEDPRAAAAVVTALWDTLAREDPRLFAALWRRANRSGRRPRPEVDELSEVEWLDELPPLEVTAPAVDLLPTRRRSFRALSEARPTVAELLPA